jgi:hypothetical protein
MTRARRPCFSALRAEGALPAAVFGPRLVAPAGRTALARSLIMMWLLGGGHRTGSTIEVDLEQRGQLERGDEMLSERRARPNALPPSRYTCKPREAVGPPHA